MAYFYSFYYDTLGFRQFRENLYAGYFFVILQCRQKSYREQ